MKKTRAWSGRPVIFWELVIILAPICVCLFLHLALIFCDRPTHFKNLKIFSYGFLGYSLKFLAIFVVLGGFLALGLGGIQDSLRGFLKLSKCIFIGLIGICFSGYFGLAIFFLLLPSFRHGSIDLTPGNIAVPLQRTYKMMDRFEYLNKAAVAHKDSAGSGIIFKETNILSHFVLGQNLDEVNHQILRLRPKPVGTGGSWDFQLPVLTIILYWYGDKPNILYPATRKYLLEFLLTEKGDEPHVWTRDLYGLPLMDTENHILGSESSRYLVNQWIAQHGNNDPRYDNIRNGLERHLLNYLARIERSGFFEYNSIPYFRYSFRALLILEAHATDLVASSARRILDRINWTYALGSLSFRRFPPFRRQPLKSNITTLSDDHSYFMRSMASAFEDRLVVELKNYDIFVGLTGYQLPDVVLNWSLCKPEDYFVCIGHGQDGSPEIYSGGPGYLITAGGVSNDLLQDSVARPTTLMLDDGAQDLKDLLYIGGSENDDVNDYKNWNNTGVSRRFAVAKGPVHIPESWIASVKEGSWNIYERFNITIAIYSSNTLGLFCILKKNDSKKQLQQLTSANKVSLLNRLFVFPEGHTIEYDINAPKNKSVIISENRIAVDRDYGSWPLLSGNINISKKYNQQ